MKTERIHSLDALRAIMMMLGLVLHSGNTYSAIDFGGAWSLKDVNAQSEFLSWLVLTIHSFRMPIFFVVSGFFGAMLYYERTPVSMIQNRVKRILFPFLVFLFLLWPTVFFAFRYSGLVFGENQEPLTNTLAAFSNTSIFLPNGTFHLWFIYYLLMFSVVSFALSLLLRGSGLIAAKFINGFTKMIGHPLLRVLVPTVVIFGTLLVMGRSWVKTSLEFMPDPSTFIFYFIFYLFGWFLYKSKYSLKEFMKYDWMQSVIGISLFAVYFLVDFPEGAFVVPAMIKSLVVWLLTFGFTGLFVRYTSKPNRTMRYISDSSYWVYLLHLPLTAFFPGLIANLPLPAVVKFGVTLGLTIIACFVTYHYLVRASFIGQFLNGRKYERRALKLVPRRL